MKSYTDLEQSRKLAEILPIDSADMYWSRCTITDFGDGELKVSYAAEPCNISQTKYTKEDVPCWSLAALLNLLPECLLYTPNPGYEGYACLSIESRYETYSDDNSVDCCVEMIIELHNKELLWHKKKNNYYL